MAEGTNLAIQRSTQDSDERSVDEIRRHIAEERENISDTVDKLGGRLQQAFDWREYVAQYPAVALGLAAGTGILLSAVFKHEPTPRERIMDAVADLTDDLTDRLSDVAGDVITRRLIPKRTVKAAATAMVARAAFDLARREVTEAVANPRLERRQIYGREGEAV
jgi:ElaB/YqjD/DUF883 family membrane-anchored ribosome-binding protein